MILLIKRKLITKATKKKYQKDYESVIEIFQKTKKFKREIMLRTKKTDREREN